MKLKEFQEKLRSCKYCKKILKMNFEPKPLVWGNQNAKIAQISQAPSFHTSIWGKPFSKDENTPDASGKQLLKWYDVPKEIFYNPDYFYITAVAHCFPGKNKGGDAAPPIECAKLWLWKELSYLNPKLFLILGRHAANFIFPNKNFVELVFTNQELLGKPAFVLPHPSPANKKWLKEHPRFEKNRLKEIRFAIHNALTC
ncbi:MAG: uracil-DNA glycosylase family protein [Candidatus Aenigmatarchaeota archaeon]